MTQLDKVKTVLATATFRYLSQGMKDRHAAQIAWLVVDAQPDSAYAALERFCADLLKEQSNA